MSTGDRRRIFGHPYCRANRETELREFHVTALRVTRAEAGNEEGLDDSRTQCTTPAVTEIAVAAVPSSPGGVYTFLPLGDDLPPPPAGHLNAPSCTHHAPRRRDAAGQRGTGRRTVGGGSCELAGGVGRADGRGELKDEGLVAEVIGDVISLSRADSATAALPGQLQGPRSAPGQPASRRVARPTQPTACISPPPTPPRSRARSSR